MKIYTKHSSKEEDAGFTAEEIRKGIHWLYADVICEECGKIQSLAMAHNDECIKCGGKVS